MSLAWTVCFRPFSIMYVTCLQCCWSLKPWLLFSCLLLQHSHTAGPLFSSLMWPSSFSGLEKNTLLCLIRAWGLLSSLMCHLWSPWYARFPCVWISHSSQNWRAEKLSLSNWVWSLISDFSVLQFTAERPPGLGRWSKYCASAERELTPFHM